MHDIYWGSVEFLPTDTPEEPSNSAFNQFVQELVLSQMSTRTRRYFFIECYPWPQVQRVNIYTIRPNCLAIDAGTGWLKNIHRWAPLPDLDRSTR